ncbi:hypothetical protein pdam_00021444 [Pocillopora damicornis]|uniref:PKD/Chitinase domain-containing protein n=1 Tax=Pocillopora damicornis TaxID=46731 RepID=A0A3M6V385_POCDA|nr:hypothetical protein pdam_00021444 [Pocillopora damicornis]
MTTCKELCCANDSCELALLVNGGCFSVQCKSAEACMPQSVKRDGVVAPRIFVRNIAKFDKKRQLESTNVLKSDPNKELIREKRIKGMVVTAPLLSNSTLSTSSMLQNPMAEPTVVNITNTTEVNLAQSSENSSSATPLAVTLKPVLTNQSETNLDTTTTGPSAKPSPEVPHKSLEVSAGDNKVLTLPVNTVSLYASAWPKETSENPYSYHWQQISAPEGSHGYMEGQDSRRVILSQLDQSGVYKFKVKVTAVDQSYGYAFINVTVLPAPRVNKPPRADISPKEQTITLPTNEVVLDGSKSSDDDKITQYKWEEVKGPLNDKNKMMSSGVDSPVLQLKSLVPGIYTFKLTVTDSDGESDSTTATVTVNDVTDTGGQTASSSLTVVVQPEKNAPPVAVAGSDKDLVFPDDSTVLDASSSHDDQKIVSYHWEQSSGPRQAEMSGVNDKVVTVKKLLEGHYVFKLTVTDDKGLTGTDTVAVNVKKDINKPPIANAGPDVTVHLPNRAAELDGSSSYDDHGIVMYEWSRDPKSPAAGDVINNSDHQAVLRLSNLVEGIYKFKLTVADGKGLKGNDDVILTVKEDQNSAHLVELYLDVDITKFTEENKEQLIRKLAVILDVQDEDIIVEHLKEAGVGHSMKVMFYVKDKLLKAKDGYEFAGITVQVMVTVIAAPRCAFAKVFGCRISSKCTLELEKAIAVSSPLYLSILLLFRIRRKKVVVSVNPPSTEDASSTDRRRRVRGKRRHRYAVLDEDEEDKLESMEMLPKGGKYLSTSLMLSDTGDDSDAESTVFEAKKRHMNGSMNGYIRKDT